MGSLLGILQRIFLLPLEIQALHLELRAERAKAYVHEHIIDAQDIVIRQVLHLLTTMGDYQSLRDFQDSERADSPVHAPRSLPNNLNEEFNRLPCYVQQYIVSLDRVQRETEGNLPSPSSPETAANSGSY